MPRFFFNVYDGVARLDDEGSDLLDWDAVRRVAVASAGEMIRDQATHLADGEDWRMEVTDEHGLLVFRLDFSLMSAVILAGRPHLRSETYAEPTTAPRADRSLSRKRV